MPEPEHMPSRTLPSWLVRFCGRTWRIIAGVGTTLLLGVGLNIVATWLTSSKGIIPADSPWGRLFAQWPWLLLIGCCLVLLAFPIWLISRWPTPPAVSPSPSTEQVMLAQTRQRVLARLRRTYKELLAQSLQGHAWIDLGLTEKPDVLRNATTLLLRSIDHQSERPLPAGTGILEAFDLAEHELLILGEPGAGKSTFLLSLAEQLLARAEADPSYPLPLLLPLASWAEKRSPLQPWITEQLRQIYGLPVSLGEHWQERDQLLPLLDGLDEMEPSARISCIEAINAYHLERPAVPLVVCSRLADYEYASAKRRLVLGRAIVVQPLSVAQADTVLAEGGPPFSALRTAFQNHPTLQELASTPLMLSILMLTYRQMPLGDLPAEESQLNQQIWQDYVRHMVQSRGNTARYPLATTQRWLGWLAREMRQRNQSLFSIRHLQADWLPPRERRFYWWSYPFLGGALLRSEER